MENKSSKVNKCCGEEMDIFNWNSTTDVTTYICHLCGKSTDDFPTPDTIEEEEFNEDAKVIDMLEGEEQCGLCEGSPCICDEINENFIHPQQDTEEDKAKNTLSVLFSKKGVDMIKEIAEEQSKCEDSPCHDCPYFNNDCVKCHSPKNENEDWEKGFTCLLDEYWQINHKHTENCEFFCEGRKKTYGFIKSLISKAKEEAYMEGAQDGFIQARQGVRAQTRADMKAEFIEKIKEKIAEYEYHKDMIHCTCLGALKEYIDDLLTSLNKE